MKPHICNPNISPVANGCHCGYWLVPVDSLKGITPNRTHAYILPDDSVWALSHDESKMVLLRASGGAQPTLVNNTDNFLVVSGSGTYSVNIDLDVARLTQLIHDEAPPTDLTGLVKNPTWNENTYTLALPVVNGTSLTIDLPVEQLVRGMSLDASTNELVLTLESGEEQRVPLNNLVVGLASEAWVRSNAVMLTGNQTVAGTKTFSGTTILARPQSSTAPTENADLVNKAYIDAKLAELSLMAYPIGSIHMSTSSANPASFFGGTWERWGNGRVPVGVDTSQTEFDTVNETGGAKTHILTAAQMPQHTHTGAAHTHTVSGTAASGGAHTHGISGTAAAAGAHGHSFSSRQLQHGTGSTLYVPGATTPPGPDYSFGIKDSAAHTHGVSGTAASGGAAATSAAGSNGAHNNLQPYITCYMWRRTA